MLDDMQWDVDAVADALFGLVEDDTGPSSFDEVIQPGSPAPAASWPLGEDVITEPAAAEDAEADEPGAPAEMSTPVRSTVFRGFAVEMRPSAAEVSPSAVEVPAAEQSPALPAAELPAAPAPEASVTPAPEVSVTPAPEAPAAPALTAPVHAAAEVAAVADQPAPSDSAGSWFDTDESTTHHAAEPDSAADGPLLDQPVLAVNPNPPRARRAAVHGRHAAVDPELPVGEYGRIPADPADPAVAAADLPRAPEPLEQEELQPESATVEPIAAAEPSPGAAEPSPVAEATAPGDEGPTDTSGTDLTPPSVLYPVPEEPHAPETRTPATARVTTKEKHPMSQIETFIQQLLSIEGATGAAIVDISSGMALATGGHPGFDLNVAAAGNSDVVRAKLRTMSDLGVEDTIEDIMLTLGTEYHLVSLLNQSDTEGLFIYLVLDRSRSNLALARHKVNQVAKLVQV